MPGSAHAGTTPTGPRPSGRHGAGLSGGMRPEVAPQPCRDGSVHVANKFNEVVDSLRKEITREYKAKLAKDQRKAFRSQMWAFRRDPESLSAEEKQRWRPSLRRSRGMRPLYKVRLRFKEIFIRSATESRPRTG